MASNIEVSDPSDNETAPKCTETSADDNTEILVQEKEQVYEKIKSKIEILDMIFHPTENNLITLGLINGKLRMLVFKYI